MTDTGKIALITGAGSGIGRALALRAGADGYHLVLVGRTEAPLRETAAMAKAPSTQIVIADITDAQGRRKIAQAAGEGLDLLINNAGALKVGPITGLTEAQAATMLNTNILGPVLLCRDLTPALARRRGRIVNIGSMFGTIAFPYFAVYSATKFALRGLSDGLRREMAGKGISVTYVAPRATRTAALAEFDAFVEPFAMKLDPPEKVADTAWRGIIKGRRTVYPGLAERVFVALQHLVPGLIDRALIKQAFAPDAQRAAHSLIQESEI